MLLKAPACPGLSLYRFDWRRWVHGACAQMKAPGTDPGLRELGRPSDARCPWLWSRILWRRLRNYDQRGDTTTVKSRRSGAAGRGAYNAPHSRVLLISIRSHCRPNSDTGVFEESGCGVRSSPHCFSAPPGPDWRGFFVDFIPGASSCKCGQAALRRVKKSPPVWCRRAFSNRKLIRTRPADSR
jgi:hypothetical protein